MGCVPCESVNADIDVHPSIHLDNGISPTQKRIFNSLWWDVPPLKRSRLDSPRRDVPPYGSVNADIEVHSSIRPNDGISPRFSDVGMCSYSEDRVCTLPDGICPRVKVLTQTCLWAFLSHHVSRNPPLWDFSLLGVTFYCRDFSLLEHLIFWC